MLAGSELELVLVVAVVVAVIVVAEPKPGGPVGSVMNGGMPEVEMNAVPSRNGAGVGGSAASLGSFGMGTVECAGVLAYTRSALVYKPSNTLCFEEPTAAVPLVMWVCCG